MPGTRVEEYVVVDKAIVGSDVTLKRECKIGNGYDIAVIGTKEEVKEGTVVE